jgi:hypothetical protein
MVCSESSMRLVQRLPNRVHLPLGCPGRFPDQDFPVCRWHARGYSIRNDLPNANIKSKLDRVISGRPQKPVSCRFTDLCTRLIDGANHAELKRNISENRHVPEGI